MGIVAVGLCQRRTSLQPVFTTTGQRGYGSESFQKQASRTITESNRQHGVQDPVDIDPLVPAGEMGKRNEAKKMRCTVVCASAECSSDLAWQYNKVRAVAVIIGGVFIFGDVAMEKAESLNSL